MTTPHIARSADATRLLQSLLREKLNFFLWRTSWLVFLMALAILMTAGFRNTIIRDAGGYLYIGQQVLRGIPPYVSLFTHKGPVAPLLVALSTAPANLLGVTDIAAARFCFCLIGAAVVVALYELLFHWTQSRRASLIGAFLLLVCYPFTFGATAGPEPKLPMLLFVVLSLYFTSRRRWFWAGLCGSLATLTWQPTVIYPAITLLLAALCGRPEDALGDGGRAAASPARQFAQRLRSVWGGRLWTMGAVLAGGLLPVALIVAYYLERGAFDRFLYCYLLFNVTDLNRGALTFVDHIRVPLQVTILNYRGALIPIVLGLAGMMGLYIRRMRRYRAWRDVWNDPYAPAFFSFPLPLLWSLQDFQGAPDFYIFLPYVALGCALLVEKGLRAMQRRYASKRVAAVIALHLLVALLGASVYQNQALLDGKLARYEGAAERILQRFGADVRVLARGQPYVLALMEKTSPTPHMNANYLFDLDMQDFPGGYAAWLKQMEAYDPQIVTIGKSSGKYAKDFKAWLAAHYVVQVYSPWTIYVKPELLDAEELASKTAGSARMAAQATPSQ